MAQVEDLKLVLKVSDAGGTAVIQKLQRELAGLGRTAAATTAQGIDQVAREIRSLDTVGVKNIETLRGQVQGMKALREQAVIGSGQFKELTKDVERYSAALKKAEGKKASGGRLAGFAKGAGAIAAAGVFGGVEGTLGAGIGMVAGGPVGAAIGGAIGAQVGQARQALGATAEYAARLDKLRIALKGVTTSQEEYQGGLKFIQDTTERFAVPQEIVTKQFTKLQASVQGAGGNLNDTKTAFNGIVAAVRATGGSLSDVDAALTATAQVFSKGKVSAEELRQQIGERLPGAFTLFAESMGLTPKELDKALEQGSVTLEDFQRFAQAIFTRYGKNAEAIAKGPASAGDRLKVQLERLNESVGRLLQPIGEAFQNTFGAIVKDIVRAADALARFLNLQFDSQKLAKAQARAAALEGQLEGATGQTRQRLLGQLTTQRGIIAQQIRLRDAKSIEVKQPEAGAGLGYGGGSGGDSGGKGPKDISKAEADFQVQVLRLKERGITLTKELIDEEARLGIAAAQSLPPQRRRVALEKVAITQRNRYKKLDEQIAKDEKKRADEKDKLVKLQLKFNELVVKGGEKAGVLSEAEAKRLRIQIKVNEGMIVYKALIGTVVKDADELKKKLQEAFEALEGKDEEGKSFNEIFKEGIKSMGEVVQNLGNLAVNVFDQIGDKLLEFITTGKANFSEFARSVLSDMAKIFIRAAMFKAITSIFPGLSPAANGAVIGAGSDPASKIVPFAKGGIVKQPTMFAYANGGAGRFGLMGEAGPEAIMPLKRGANGRLGVEASGGGTNVVVNVDAKGTQAQGSQPNSAALGRAIGAAVQAELVKQKRPGGLLA